ncbi:MAG: (d)CMP kinase [Aquificaceae bacterium]|nr:(d)CMP kinase [Aquificaceae bacterium]
MKVTIDGPAGSGKSTVAKEVSRRLGFPYLNTGLLYRAFAYMCMSEGLKGEEVLKVFEKPIKVRLDIATTEVFYGGEEIGQKLGSEEVGSIASQIATLPAFRERINQFFRALVGEVQAVIEGRDAGTHIFPDAELKIFLTASAEERARRRWEQLRLEGIEVDYQEILRAILERDERDKNRPIYPFKPAEDAVLIDTTQMGIGEVVEKVLELIKERVLNGGLK